MKVERYTDKETIAFTDLCLGDSFIYNNAICIKTNFADSVCVNALMYSDEAEQWQKERFSSLDRVIPIETKLVVL